MGQKVNPNGLRVGVIKPWDTTWYANKRSFGKFLKEDNTIRTFIKKKHYADGISKITIERGAGKIFINIHTGRPGMLIGKQGAGVEQLKNELKKLIKTEVRVSVSEVKKVDADSQLVAESVAQALEKRMAYRRAVKQAIGRVMRTGVKGVKIMVSGRLDGREIAGTEQYHDGSIPLQTLRADIDYGFAEAHTTFGVIGVKCWIYKGEILGKKGGEA